MLACLHEHLDKTPSQQSGLNLVTNLQLYPTAKAGVRELINDEAMVRGQERLVFVA